MAVTALPGAADYFINWLRQAAPEADHSGHKAPSEPVFLNGYQPRFFDASDFEALESLCSLLIPTDETPGAKEARCAYYIDYVLAAAGPFAPERQKQWRDAMNKLRQAGFHKADSREREELLRQISAPEADSSVKHDAYGAYRLFKTENAFAFYSSRLGLIEALDYRGNSYNKTFPACEHPEHREV